MKEKKAIQESDGIQKDWYIEARAMTREKLPAFIDKLMDNYKHDYGTICHAIAAAAIGAAWSVERGPQGGITGFQAGAVMWEMIHAWGTFDDGPKRMQCFNDLLYPQMEYKFRTISRDTADWIKTEAAKKVAEWGGNGGSSEVLAHLERVASGWVPFGLRVSDE
jgi:hypothetical protein